MNQYEDALCRVCGEIVPLDVWGSNQQKCVVCNTAFLALDVAHREDLKIHREALFTELRAAAPARCPYCSGTGQKQSVGGS